jgi:hypothetical protein
MLEIVLGPVQSIYSDFRDQTHSVLTQPGIASAYFRLERQLQDGYGRMHFSLTCFILDLLLRLPKQELQARGCRFGRLQMPRPIFDQGLIHFRPNSTSSSPRSR